VLTPTSAIDGGLPGGPMLEYELISADHLAFRTWASRVSGAAITGAPHPTDDELPLGRRRVIFHPFGLIVEGPQARIRFDWWQIREVVRTRDHFFLRIGGGDGAGLIIPRRAPGADDLGQMVLDQLDKLDLSAIDAARRADPTYDWGARPANAVEFELTEAEHITALEWSHDRGYHAKEVGPARKLLIRKVGVPSIILLAVGWAVAIFMGPIVRMAVAVVTAALIGVVVLGWLVAPRILLRLQRDRIHEALTRRTMPSPTWLWLDDAGVCVRAVGQASHAPWQRLSELDERDGLVLWRSNNHTVAVPRRADPALVDQLVAGLRAGMASAQVPLNESAATPLN
jgi:hypothetical protein